MITRRGFLAALPALVAGLAAVRPAPEPVPVTWSNLDTAAPLTRESLQRAIAMLESTPIYSVPMRYTIVHDRSFGVVYNTGG